MSLPLRPEIRQLGTCVHGGMDYAELAALGLKPENVLDFSVCTNPYPPPPGIRKMLRSVAFDRYPDTSATELGQALAGKLGLHQDNILAGNGTTELIRLIALAYFRPGDTVLILGPTYGEYEIACGIMGASPVKYHSSEAGNFQPDLEDIARLIRKTSPRSIFICNPNNPTGRYLSREEIAVLLQTSEESLFIFDEAYVNFAENAWDSTGLITRNNVVILRSMTKDYALAGLRLGYAIAHDVIIAAMQRVCPPWNVNTIAQRAGIIALEDAGYLERSRLKIIKAKQYLVKELTAMGFTTSPSDANFFLVKVASATAFRETLLKQGVLVRDCTSFGLPRYVRIAPRMLSECQKLVSIVEVLKENTA